MRKIILITILILSIMVVGCTRDHSPPPHFPEILAFKAHTIQNITLIPNQWNDIYWEETVINESQGDIKYLNQDTPTENRTIIVVNGTNDIFEIEGRIHSLWIGPVGQDVTLATRILTSTDEGETWTESRCTQTLDKEDRGENAEGTQPYSGTISVEDKIWLKLQVYTDNENMILQGNSLFDNPVSSTIIIDNLGINK